MKRRRKVTTIALHPYDLSRVRARAEELGVSACAFMQRAIERALHDSGFLPEPIALGRYSAEDPVERPVPKKAPPAKK